MRTNWMRRVSQGSDFSMPGRFTWSPSTPILPSNMGQCTCPMCDSTERRSILQNSSKIFIRFNNFKIFRWRISLMRQLNALPSCHILDPSLVISQATPSNGWPLSPLSLQPRHPALKLNKGLRETKTESQFRVPFWQTATSCVMTMRNLMLSASTLCVKV
jgi:hypothetical protein